MLDRAGVFRLIKGKWPVAKYDISEYKYTDGKGAFKHIECSNCEYIFPCDDAYATYGRFCPACGAYMENFEYRKILCHKCKFCGTLLDDDNSTFIDFKFRPYREVIKCKKCGLKGEYGVEDKQVLADYDYGLDEKIKNRMMHLRLGEDVEE